MRIQPIQTKVLPGLIKGAKSLPKGALAAGSAIAAATMTSIVEKNDNAATKVAYDYCGSTESYCVPLLSF